MWQPIETAPESKDMQILAYSKENDSIFLAEWVAPSEFTEEGYWAECLGATCEYTCPVRPITHWMPLPSSPLDET